MGQMSIIRTNNSCFLYIPTSVQWLLLQQVMKKDQKKVIFHYSAWLVYTNDSFMHQKAVVYGLPDHGNDKDGFTLIQRLDAAQKTDFSSLFFLKKMDPVAFYAGFYCGVL